MADFVLKRSTAFLKQKLASFPKMSVTVAEEGNKRKSGPSSSEVRQSLLDIKSWFVRVSGGDWAANAGATSVDLQRLEKASDTQIPDTLLTMLTEVNGGLWFDDKPSYTSEEIITVCGEGGKRAKIGWKESFVPFAGDDSAILLVDSKRCVDACRVVPCFCEVVCDVTCVMCQIFPHSPQRALSPSLFPFPFPVPFPFLGSGRLYEYDVEDGLEDDAEALAESLVRVCLSVCLSVCL